MLLGVICLSDFKVKIVYMTEPNFLFMYIFLKTNRTYMGSKLASTGDFYTGNVKIKFVKILSKAVNFKVNNLIKKL